MIKTIVNLIRGDLPCLRQNWDYLMLTCLVTIMKIATIILLSTNLLTYF